MVLNPAPADSAAQFGWFYPSFTPSLRAMSAT
jgi:hypothetical protein